MIYQVTTDKELTMLSGDKIKLIRLSRGLSQSAIAKECGVGKDTISKIENFKFIPSEELYEKIIKAIYTLEKKK